MTESVCRLVGWGVMDERMEGGEAIRDAGGVRS